ncbi:MAG: MFS transporter, partial [Chloroflexi bacterium]|nr:MFS transporter [Chloroflexota bacterium]
MSLTQERPEVSTAPVAVGPLTHSGLTELGNGASATAATAPPATNGGAMAPAAPSPLPAVAAATKQPRIFYGWWMVGAGFLAAFTTAGAQGYIAGAFMVPMSDELGWTRAQFLYGQTVWQFFMAFAGFFVGAYV